MKDVDPPPGRSNQGFGDGHDVLQGFVLSCVSRTNGSIQLHKRFVHLIEARPEYPAQALANLGTPLVMQALERGEPLTTEGELDNARVILEGDSSISSSTDSLGLDRILWAIIADLEAGRSAYVAIRCVYSAFLRASLSPVLSSA